MGHGRTLQFAGTPQHGIVLPTYMQSAYGRTIQACLTNLRAFGARPAVHSTRCSTAAAQQHQGASRLRQIIAAKASGAMGRSAEQAPSGLVMGIESSCDDTGVAIVTRDGRILGQALATQAEIHRAWGGVVPTLAMEAHAAAIDATVDAALTEAGITAPQLSAVAVTVGPGLQMCLQVGVEKARQVAAHNRLPIIGVHHMEAHALMARAAGACAAGQAPPQYPFLALLVSGGHNLLLVVRGVGDYQMLGSTVDDAVGEAFDKVARLLGLDANGAALEALALEGDAKRFAFPVPMRKHASCDFSYAGLKTALRLAIEKEAPGPATNDNRQVRADLAASFQRVAVQHLMERCRRAAQWAKESCPYIKSIVVSGGVACNKLVRTSLEVVAQEAGLQLVAPPPRLCTDNGAMVAWAGQERLALGLVCAPPTVESLADRDMLFDARGGWLQLRPRWPLTEERHPRAVVKTAYRGLKQKRIHPSLVELTAAALTEKHQLRGNGASSSHTGSLRSGIEEADIAAVSGTEGSATRAAVV